VGEAAGHPEKRPHSASAVPRKPSLVRALAHLPGELGVGGAGLPYKNPYANWLQVAILPGASRCTH